MQILGNKTVRTIAAFASSNLLATACGLVGALVQARYIDPKDMGVFRTFTVVAGYLTFLHLGVFDGLQRELPMQMARGNKLEAENAATACLSWVLLISTLSAAGFLSLAAWAAFHHEWMYFWGWLAFVPTIVATFYGGYLGTTFRTGDQFVALSRTNLFPAILGLVVLPLLPRFGYYAACLRNAVIFCAQLSLLHLWRPLKLKPRINLKHFYQTIRIGLPLSGIGYIYTSFWVSVEGTVILKWFGTTALGLYAVAATTRGLGSALAANVNQVISVKVYEQYGRTGSIRDCIKIIVKPTLFGAIGSIPLIIIGWFLVPPAVRILIPKYVDATRTMQLMLPMVSLSFLNLPMVILWASANLLHCFISVVIGFFTFLISAYCLNRYDLGIQGVLIGSMIGYVAVFMSSCLFIAKAAAAEGRGICSVPATVPVKK